MIQNAAALFLFPLQLLLFRQDQGVTFSLRQFHIPFWGIMGVFFRALVAPSPKGKDTRAQWSKWAAEGGSKEKEGVFHGRKSAKKGVTM